MPAPNRTHLSDLRGLTRMAVDAAVGVTDIVEKMHHTIQSLAWPVGRSAAGATRGITGLVYRSVRGGVRLVGLGIDAGFAPVIALLPQSDSTAARDAFVSVVNGVYGDYLVRTGNPLAIDMSLRYRGRRIELEDPASVFGETQHAAPTPRLLVLVHGLCLNDRQWTRQGHDHGAVLADELGYTPLYLRYNSGLRIANNGRAFAKALEKVVRNWPQPVQELVIIGHSMGGLVSRSACHYGREAGHVWLEHLRKLVFLGTPLHGAPLERAGQWVDFALELSPYSAPFTRIGRTRSAGITDLRHGSITDDKHEFVPLPAGVTCHAAAATLGARRGVLSERLVGDGLVPLNSALGHHADASRSFAIPKGHQWIGYRMGHLELLNRREVYTWLRSWLQDTATPPL